MSSYNLYVLKAVQGSIKTISHLSIAVLVLLAIPSIVIYASQFFYSFIDREIAYLIALF